MESTSWLRLIIGNIYFSFCNGRGPLVYFRHGLKPPSRKIVLKYWKQNQKAEKRNWNILHLLQDMSMTLTLTRMTHCQLVQMWTFQIRFVRLNIFIALSHYILCIYCCVPLNVTFWNQIMKRDSNFYVGVLPCVSNQIHSNRVCGHT